MNRSTFVTALALAAFLVGVPAGLAAKGGGNNGGHAGTNTGVSGNMTLTFQASWEPGWVNYYVSGPNGGDPKVLVHHSCYAGVQLVYQYAKAVWWSNTNPSVGDATFSLVGDTCTAYAEPSDGSQTSNVVTYTVAALK